MLFRWDSAALAPADRELRAQRTESQASRKSGSSHPVVSGYFANAGFIVFIALSFSGGRNIFRAGALEDFLCSFGPRGIVRVYRKQDAAILLAAFVAFGFVLGNSHAD